MLSSFFFSLHQIKTIEGIQPLVGVSLLLRRGLEILDAPSICASGKSFRQRFVQLVHLFGDSRAGLVNLSQRKGLIFPIEEVNAL